MRGKNAIVAIAVPPFIIGGAMQPDSATLTIKSPLPANWDAFVELQAGHILQTSRWGELKRAFGWQDYLIALADQHEQIMCGALVLFRTLPLGLGAVGYIPRGPLIDWNNRALVEQLLDALDSLCRQHRAILLKLEPDVEDSDAMHKLLTGQGFRESPHVIQPPRTILLEIGGAEDVILARMNQGTRRKIRTAERREVVVRRGSPADLPSYSRLAALTGQRDGFGVHSSAYYEKAFELFSPSHADLLMASFAGRDLAGLMSFTLGKRAWYLYGASSNEERERMPNYALQWEAIRRARERGCTVYDLWGVPDHDEAVLEADFQNRADGLWGVYGFKRGFGGRIWRAVGAWDQVYNPVLYFVYSLVMRQRADTQG